MHHEPLGAAGDAIESAPLPPPRKIVIVPPSELSLPCKDLGSNGLISLSIVKVGLGVPSDESATVVAPGPALGSGEPAASARAGTRLRKIVIVPPSELSLPCKDLGSNGLISLSIIPRAGRS